MNRRHAIVALLAVCGAGASARYASATSAIAVANAWSRPATDTGVVYLTIVNHGATADRLIGAAAPMATSVEVHESTTGSGAMNGMTMSGVMSMHRVRSVAIPAHGSIAFRPGSYHLMLIGLHRDLAAGRSFRLRLLFASAGWVALNVPVRAF